MLADHIAFTDGPPSEQPKVEKCKMIKEKKIKYNKIQLNVSAGSQIIAAFSYYYFYSLLCFLK